MAAFAFWQERLKKHFLVNANGSGKLVAHFSAVSVMLYRYIERLLQKLRGDDVNG